MSKKQVKYNASYIFKVVSVQLFFCFKNESKGKKVMMRGKRKGKLLKMIKTMK